MVILREDYVRLSGNNHIMTEGQCKSVLSSLLAFKPVRSIKVVGNLHSFNNGENQGFFWYKLVLILISGILNWF